MENRAIKFRAWHRGEPSKGRFKGIEPVMLYDDKPGDCLVFLSQGQPVDVMQYIGLKDRKGLDIYEGDKTSSGYIIMWNNEKSLFGEHLYQEVLQRWSLMSYPIDVSRIEIIGNIHENPDLTC